ncbi:MAG: nicotinamide riboside transporter PnuC [bacterium]
MSSFTSLLNAHIHVLGADVLWREIIGNAFGLGSAVLGMQRRVSAWWVGLVGNVLLVTVFLGGAFHTPQDKTLWGQVGRQVMFAVLSIYGWWRWRQTRAARLAGDTTASDAPAVEPRWATMRERLLLLAGAAVGMAVLVPTLKALDSYGPKSDAWILTGSLLATVGMAFGLREFWLIWIAVDAVGVPLLLRAGYYPSALMYIVYGAFCLYGFARWVRIGRSDAPTPTRTEVEALG